MTQQIIDRCAGIFLVSDPTIGVRFQMWPDSIEDSKSVNWGSIDVIGRSEPVRTYHSSTAQMFSFTLMFVASVDADDQGTTKDVQDKVNFLKSLTYPVRTPSGYTTYPPAVHLIVGNLINSRCIATSVDVNWTGPWEVIAETATLGGTESNFQDEPQVASEFTANLPISASVKITLATAHARPLDSEQVRRYGDVSSKTNFLADQRSDSRLYGV